MALPSGTWVQTSLGLGHTTCSERTYRGHLAVGVRLLGSRTAQMFAVSGLKAVDKPEHGWLRRTGAGDAEGDFAVYSANTGSKIGEVLDHHENKDIGFDPECGPIHRLVGEYRAVYTVGHASRFDLGGFPTVREAALAIHAQAKKDAAAANAQIEYERANGWSTD